MQTALAPPTPLYWSLRTKGPHTYDILTERCSGLAQKQMVVLIGCASGTVTRGKGVQKSQIFADIIRERPLSAGVGALQTPFMCRLS